MDGHLIVTSRPAVDPAVVARLGALGVATVHEAQGKRGLLGPDIRPIQPGLVAAGRALTCSIHPGDNLMVLAALELCEPGDLLVVGTSSPVLTGVLGEIIASILLARGAVGAVVDNGVRDVARLRRMGLPVWSRGISAMGTTKAGAGSVNTTVVCGGALVHAGDVVVADDDGVVVVAHAEAEEAAALGEQRTVDEDAYLARIAAGDIPGLTPALRDAIDRLGVRRVATLATASVD